MVKQYREPTLRPRSARKDGTTYDETLTKLAMELTEWPKPESVPLLSCNENARRLKKDGICWMKIRLDLKVPGVLAETEEGHIAESTWKARRAELINEPDDADAPGWAKWKAQDADGEWGWFEDEPVPVDRCWVLDGTHKMLEIGTLPVGTLPAGHDWRDTLKRVERDTELPPAVFPLNSESHGIMHHDPQTVAEVQAWAEKHPEDAALELMLLRRKVEDATGENQRGGKCRVSEGEENV